MSGVSSEKARTSLKPETRHLKSILREGFTTPDNVPKKDLFFWHITRSEVHSKIDNFFDRFRMGTPLHQCGIRKRHGHGVRPLIKTIFTLPFVGKNFFRGIVINEDLPFSKDAAYELLKCSTYN